MTSTDLYNLSENYSQVFLQLNLIEKFRIRYRAKSMKVNGKNPCNSGVYSGFRAFLFACNWGEVNLNSMRLKRQFIRLVNYCNHLI